MPIQLPDQGSVDLGRSRDASPDTYAPVRTNNAGQGMEQLAKALSGFAGTAQQAQDTETKQQVDQSALWVDKVRGSLGDAPAAGDINNLLSPLHPLAQARISQDLGYAIGVTARQKAIEEGIPNAASLSPTEAKAAYEKVRNTALASVVGHGNQFYSAGFMSAFNQGLDSQSQKDSDARIQKGREIQIQGVGNSVYDRSSAIIDGRQSYSNNQQGGSVAPTGILSLVSRGESGGNYNILQGGKTANLTDMSIQEVMDLQKQGWGGESTAAGRWQIIKGTLKQTAQELGLDPATTKFTPEVQDALANQLLKKRGYDDYLAGKMSASDFVDNIRKEWTSLNNVSDAQILTAAKNGSLASTVSGSSSITPTNSAADPNFDAPPGSPTTQTPGSNQSVDQRSDAALLSPKVLALRNMFFGVDSEYQKTGTLQKNEIRDAAANSWLRLAIDRRDPSILDAMPQEMMTPEMRTNFSNAREHIANLSYQKYERDRTMDANKRADELRGFHQDIIGRLAKGEDIDPDKVSRRPDGSVNAEAYTYAVQMQSVDRMNEGRSRVNAANLQDLLIQSGTTGKPNSIVTDDSILNEKVRSGGDPNMGDYRDAIMRRSDINSKEKMDLVAKLPELMRGVAVMQHPEVVTGLNNLVQNRINGILAGPKGDIYRLNWPQLSADVASIYNDTVKSGIMSSISSGKGVPTGEDLRKIIDDSARRAMEYVNFATSHSENVSKDYFTNAARDAHNGLQTTMVQTPGKLVDVADPVTGKVTKVWQAADTQATPAQETTPAASGNTQQTATSVPTPAEAPQTPPTPAAPWVAPSQSSAKTMRDTIAGIQDNSQNDLYGSVKNVYDHIDQSYRQWFDNHQASARNEIAFQEYLRNNAAVNKELYELHAKTSYGSKAARAKATEAYQNRYNEIKSGWTPPESVNHSYQLPDIGLRMGGEGEPAVKIGNQGTGAAPEQGAASKKRFNDEVIDSKSDLDREGGSSLSKTLFAGASAEDLDSHALDMAKTLKEQGYTAEDVYNLTSPKEKNDSRTGFFQGNDGKWRFEIDDSKASIDTSTMKTVKSGEAVKLGDLLSHKELYKNYPEARNIVVKRVSDEDAENGLLGSFNAKTGLLQVSDDDLESKSTLLHEVQHWIQNKEGFGRGGSAAGIKPSIELSILTQKLDKRLEAINHLLGDAKLTPEERDAGRKKYEEINTEINRLEEYKQKVLERFESLSDHEVYRRLQGENESRNVETRSNMNSTTRRRSLPLKTQEFDKDEEFSL